VHVSHDIARVCSCMSVAITHECIFVVDNCFCGKVPVLRMKEDIGVIERLWLCELLIKIDHADVNYLVGRVPEMSITL